MKERKKVTVEIISDTVCPWCYVGKKRLEKAMSRYSDSIDFEVHWCPYFLDPKATNEGISKRQYYEDIFGPEKAQGIFKTLARVFAEEGVAYKEGGLVGNTLLSHRLVWHAGQSYGPKVQNDLVEELFRLYFTEEKFLCDIDVLVAAGEKVGITDARSFLADANCGLKEVEEELRRTRLISSVPHYIFDGMYELSGAQSAGIFEELFDELVN